MQKAYLLLTFGVKRLNVRPLPRDFLWTLGFAFLSQHPNRYEKPPRSVGLLILEL